MAHDTRHVPSFQEDPDASPIPSPLPRAPRGARRRRRRGPAPRGLLPGPRRSPGPGRPTGGRGDDDPDRRGVRRVRAQGGRPVRRVHGAEPGCADRADLHRAQRELLPAAADPPGHGQRPRRRPGRRGQQHRGDHRDAGRQAGRPRQGAGRGQGGVPAVEVGAGHREERCDRRARHRHRPAGHLLPQGPLRGGRAAHRPGGGRRALGGRLGQVPGDGQGLQGEGGRRQGVRGLGVRRDGGRHHAAAPSGSTTTRARSSTRPTRRCAGPSTWRPGSPPRG